MNNIKNQPVQSDKNDQEFHDKSIKNHSDRLLSVDIVRGIAIFGVLFIHPMIYGTWYTEAIALSVVPMWVVAIFAPIILMGTWG